MQQELTTLQQRVQKLMSDWYKVQVTKYDVYYPQRITTKKANGSEELDEGKLKQLIQ